MPVASGHRLKLGRARKHLNAFEYQMRVWRAKHAADAYALNVEFEKQIRIRYAGAPDPPPTWGLLIGDYLHNLRSCLDHLALELATAHTGRLTHAQASTSEFPIFGTRASTERERQNRIGCMHPSAQAIIERLQPYLRGQGYTDDPLWLLHELSNADKHRLFLFVVTSSGLIRFSGKNFAGFEEGEIVASQSEPSASVIRRTMRSNPSGQPVEMDIDLAFSIRFEDGPAKGLEAVPTLRALYRYVERSVVMPLEAYL